MMANLEYLILSIGPSHEYRMGDFGEVICNRVCDYGGARPHYQNMQKGYLMVVP